MKTEKHAAEILLDRGVAWPIVAPLFLRLFGKKTIAISVKALKLGTLLELSRLYTSLGITEADFKSQHELIQKNLKTVCIIVAIAILNSKIRIKLFAKPFAGFIERQFTANMLLEVMIFIATYSGVGSFSNTIRLLGDLSITAPKNLSPKD